MRSWLARLIQPTVCGHKIRIVQSYRSPDRLVNSEVIPGVAIVQWQVCGRPVGHDGEHGGWGRSYHWRLRLANWISE